MRRVTPKRAISGATRGERTATRAPPGKIASPVSSGDQPRSDCRYSVTMNWNPTQPPKSDIAREIRPDERPGAQDAEPDERRGGSALARDEDGEDRGDAGQRAERAQRAPADGRRLDEREHEQQHRRGHGDRARDVERARRSAGGCCAERGGARRASATSATGAGRKNTQRQPISVSRPPKTRPSEKPVAPVAV